MRRFFSSGFAVFLALGSALASLAGAEDPADLVLKEKGLRKSGTTFVLPAESEVQKQVVEARSLYKQMTTALLQQKGYDQGLRENQQAIRILTEQRIELNQRLAQASNVAENNQLVAMVNGVSDRLNLIHQQQADTGMKQRIDSEVANRREAYVQAVLDLRQLVDATAETYGKLAGDKDVKEALSQVNEKSKGKATLGPSKSFLANVALLEKAEAAVLSETVDLRKEGGIFWLDVTFNGKVTRPMAFDTGAADVVLPADLADLIGLKPGPDDPIVKCRVADGSIVEARQMTVPSMRVGKFTVKDVNCTVMPADKKEVPPLLGQSFQRNFMLKFSPDSGKLILSKVDSPEVGEGAARPKTPTRNSSRKR
ncbi:retropepsin-like aspartic protease family protein [Tundrisphaera lichenicola]|uniref:retropepsin-like aspartic protease family protein n=1 Tax=Tundrisphaera lichenicola TaxID=2029860 RepID=UPI003EB6B4FF